MVYMVTFTINVPPMLVYIYHTWILWGIHESSTSKTLRIRISRSPSDKNHHNIPQENAIPRARALSSIKRCQILSESPPKVGQCQTRHVQLWEKREPASFLRPPTNAVRHVAENLWPGTAHTCKGHKRTRTANFPKERKTA